MQKNENLDFYLTIHSKPLHVLATSENLIAIFAKHLKGSQSQQINIDDFEKLKVIGKGGFSEKVYLARKKDNGQLYAIKTICKKFILEE